MRVSSGTIPAPHPPTYTPSGCASLCTCPPADESLHPPVQQEVILPVGSRVVLLEPKALATFSLITFYWRT